MALIHSFESWINNLFWSKVESVCRGHVTKQIKTFASQNADKHKWAEKRYKALSDRIVIKSLIGNARDRLKKGRPFFIDQDGFAAFVKMPNGKICNPPCGNSECWFVMLTVFPSAVDSEFLAAIPTNSFEEFAHIARQLFRNALPNHWWMIHYAHWILLIDESERSTSIHLHTWWSFKQGLEWFKEETIPAPSIIPLSLLKEAPRLLMEQLLHNDFEQFKIKL